MSSIGQFIHFHQAMSLCMSRTALVLMTSVKNIPDLKARRIHLMSNQHEKSSIFIKLLLYQVLALSVELSKGNCCSREYDVVHMCLHFFDTVIIQKAVTALF